MASQFKFWMILDLTACKEYLIMSVYYYTWVVKRVNAFQTYQILNIVFVFEDLLGLVLVIIVS